MYDPFFISTYNVFYTSLPIIVVGVFDQDVDSTASMRYGALYFLGITNELFNRKLFAMDAIRGLFSSLVLTGFFAGIFDTILNCSFFCNFFLNSTTVFFTLFLIPIKYQ